LTVRRYRTPLRYPGGKQRLTPFIREVLEENSLLGGTYVEPYAGGAGVAMNLLLDRHVCEVLLNDSSVHIYSFWRSLLTQTDVLCARVAAAALSIEEWKRQREVVRHPAEHDALDVGFATFYLNRCNRSGVLSGGVIGGLEQRGRWRIDARFPRNELIRRIEAIAAMGDSIHISNLDAEDFMAESLRHLRPDNTLIYCDPPYFERAQRLYPAWYEAEDHKRLATFIQGQLGLPWLVSYDNHPELPKLYARRRRFSYWLQYSAVRAYEGSELFIFADDLKMPRTSSFRPVGEALELVELGA